DSATLNERVQRGIKQGVEEGAKRDGSCFVLGQQNTAHDHT
ncbi:hypothetical protein Trydic_g11870, partial [Trypoxylus dichotomus]